MSITNRQDRKAQTSLESGFRHTFLITGWPPRSLTPSTTSSFASTVPSAGHQLTGTSAYDDNQANKILFQDGIKKTDYGINLTW